MKTNKGRLLDYLKKESGWVLVQDLIKQFPQITHLYTDLTDLEKLNCITSRKIIKGQGSHRKQIKFLSDNIKKVRCPNNTISGEILKILKSDKDKHFSVMELDQLLPRISKTGIYKYLSLLEKEKKIAVESVKGKDCKGLEKRIKILQPKPVSTTYHLDALTPLAYELNHEKNPFTKYVRTTKNSKNTITYSVIKSFLGPGRVQYHNGDILKVRRLDDYKGEDFLRQKQATEVVMGIIRERNGVEKNMYLVRDY